MKRQLKHRPGNPPHSCSDSAPVDCRAVVLVDGRPLRNKAGKDYRKATRDLERARLELERFHNEDQPAYSRWYHRQFGVLLTELRELDEKLLYRQQIFYAIAAEIQLTGCSPGQAWRRVTDASRRAEDGSCEDLDEEEGGDSFEEDDEEAGDPHARFSEGAFNDRDFDFGGRSGAAQPERKRASARLKELYRALVRRLHPDTQTNMTAQRLEWWHQAQEAYCSDDAEQLEVILSLCEMDDAGTTNQVSVSLLMRITGRLKQSLRQLKAQLRVTRRKPAWGFCSRTDLASLAEKMTAELEILKALRCARLEWIERRIAELKGEADAEADIEPPRRRRQPVHW